MDITAAQVVGPGVQFKGRNKMVARPHLPSAMQEFSIVAVDRFIHATRDSGYKSTSSAVAELVDNSIQAHATEITINVTEEPDQGEFPLVLTVLDNGSGMDADTLRTALRFGGSSRFNDRSGLGRYGMGLPNSSLSQAKRVTIYSWASDSGSVLQSHLDLDEIASGTFTEIPEPTRVARPPFVNGHPSGTAVTWTRCDRLENRRVSTLVRKLQLGLGRQFRHFLWGDVLIRVNGEDVVPIDPLFLDPRAKHSGASQFGDDLVYAVSAHPERRSTVGAVRVRFSELPVAKWAKLSNTTKRELGVAKGAGVSIVRSGREVDHGWFFLGGKRRENYDDWWRCEVQFDPVLDEAFGITHSKQQIRPRPHLVEALGPDIEAIARALSTRARKAHHQARVAERFTDSEKLAHRRDGMLAPLPRRRRSRDEQVLSALASKMPSKVSLDFSSETQRTAYHIVPAALSETEFFNYARDDGRLVLVLNPEHPFYKIVYSRLLNSESPQDVALRSQIDLLLLAAARNEALLDDREAVEVAESIRKGWSDTLATFLTN